MLQQVINLFVTGGIGAVPIMGIIMAVVKAMKSRGMAGDKLTIAAYVVSVLLGSGYMVATNAPILSGAFAEIWGYWFGILLFGILCGFTTTNVYDVVRGDKTAE